MVLCLCLKHFLAICLLQDCGFIGLSSGKFEFDALYLRPLVGG